VLPRWTRDGGSLIHSDPLALTDLQQVPAQNGLTGRISEQAWSVQEGSAGGAVDNLGNYVAPKLWGHDLATIFGRLERQYNLHKHRRFFLIDRSR
jgi:hypothetical protein